MSHTQVPSLKAAPGEAGLESRLAALAGAVRDLEARVAALETGVPRPAAPGASFLDGGELALSDPALPSPARILGLFGRVCLILGGAYLIRTLVDAGTLPPAAGVAAGLAYAATWAFLANRARQGLDASYHALASILIAYPLIVESTTRFGILAPGLAAFLLLAMTCLHAAVAWRRDLHPILWIATLFSLASGFAMMASRQAIEPFTAVFLALGAGALWLTYGRRWHGLRWPTALAADASVLVLALVASWPGGPPPSYRGLSPNRALFLALALAAIYIGSFAARMLQRRRVVNAFEMIQTALVLLAGFGGAVRIAGASGSGLGLLGAGISLAGAGCYAAAVPFAEDQEDTRANFNFFTFLALIFLLLGGPIVLSLPAFAAFSGGLGLAVMAAALRLRRTVLVFQCGLYLTASTLASGLLPWAFRAFTEPAGPAVPVPAAGLASLAALSATLLLFFFRRPADPVPVRMRWTVLVLGTQAAAICGALIIRACCGSGAADPGGLALARTGVLSVLAVALAWLGRRAPELELKWMVYPILALTTLKFLFEDMAVGRPLTLFLAFMFFGATLILSPRLLKAAAPGGADGGEAP